MKRIDLTLAICTGAVILARAAQATFHIVVIDEAFFGFPQAPQAQYVMLRMEAGAQTNVHGQPLPIDDGTGSPLAPFATFCASASECNLPHVSPACSAGGCPSPLQAAGARVLVATAQARDLFCVTPDLLTTGTLPFPNGRVCWAANCEPFCTTPGPVDCLAYGDFPAAENGIFGMPASTPVLGDALLGSPARQSQFNGGTLLEDAAGFSLGPPSPQNFHGDVGEAGRPGDPEGSGTMGPANLIGEIAVLFQFDSRCAPGLAPNRRGADANLDSHLTAADLIATIQIISAAQG